MIDCARGSTRMSARNRGTPIMTGLLERITLMYELKPHVPVDRATVPRIAYPSQGFLVANSKADPLWSL
jgi:hypothetical protein